MVTHIYIPLTKISLSEDFNPRSEENKGLDQNEMNALRDAICERGLEASIIVTEDVKTKDGMTYKVVAGERRYRCISRLVAENKECYDPTDGQNRTAHEIYVERGVECKVRNFKTEVEKKIVAIQENVLHEPINDFEMLNQLEWLAKNGVVQQTEQAKIMSRCEGWVSQSWSLLEKKEIVDSIRKGKITRTAALNFIAVDDDKIPAVLDDAWNKAVEAKNSKIEKSEKEKEEASKEIGKSIAVKSISDFTGASDTSHAKAARKNLTRGKLAFNKAERDIDKAQKEDVVITDSIVVKANKSVGNNDKIRKPRPVADIRAKYKKMFEDECDPNLTDEQYQGALAALRWALDCSTDEDLSTLLTEVYEDEE